jgi:hypothetical protein
MSLMVEITMSAEVPRAVDRFQQVVRPAGIEGLVGLLGRDPRASQITIKQAWGHLVAQNGKSC